MISGYLGIEGADVARWRTSIHDACQPLEPLILRHSRGEGHETYLTLGWSGRPPLGLFASRGETQAGSAMLNGLA